MASTKKISELPIISALSGSAASVIPVVVGGTTNQISAEGIIPFVTAYTLSTSSYSVDSASFVDRLDDLELNNSLQDAAIIINGTDVQIVGELRTQKFYADYITSSITVLTGSNDFGDQPEDTHTFIGTITLNGLALGTNELMAYTASQNTINSSVDAHILKQSAQTGSQDLVNLRISSTTGSINTTTSSFDSVFLRISSTTGSINTTTSSFNSVFLGISSFTGSFNSISGSYATTGSNTFKADQIITGSLSISAGEFNVTTGSGNVTSSLRFDHTQNNGVTLQLSHDNNGASADHSFNVNVWSAGVYTEFVRNGTPYSILNVEAFDDNKIYLYRDTRLYNKSLVIDNNLLVNGVITGSILATNGVVSSSNQLVELNVQTGSQDAVNFGISSVTGSLIGITNGLMAFTASLDSTYATDAQVAAAVAGLNTQTGSQNSINSGISAVTGAFSTQLGSIDSHILGVSSYTGSNELWKAGIRGELSGLEAWTASLDNTYATDAQVAAAVSKLNIQTGSQNSINSGISAVTGAFSTELGGIQNNITSFNNVFGGISAVTGAFATELGQLQTQNTSQGLVNSGISAVTGAFSTELGGIQTSLTQFSGIEAYTSSLKSVLTINGGDVEFSGKLTAQEIHTTFTTSSVLFQSGSTKFGDTNDDKHEFTGSIYSTGTITTTGNLVANAGSSTAVYVYNSDSLRGKLSMTGNEGDLTLYNSSASPKVYLSSYYDSYFNAGNVIVGGGTALATAANRGNITINGTNTSILSFGTSDVLKSYVYNDGTDMKFNSGNGVFTFEANNVANSLYISGSGVGIGTLPTKTKFRVYNPTTDATYSSKIQAVFGVNDYLDSDAVNIFGGNLAETQFGNGATNRPAVISMGGNLNVDETMGVINFFSSTNDDGYRSRANIHGAYINTGTAGKYGGELRFQVAGDNVANPQESFRLAYDGDVKVLTGNLVIGTAGKGIDFSATANGSGTVNSELLSDYEEGSWTPVLRDDPSAGNTATAAVGGFYTKVGRLVNLQCSLSSIDSGSMTLGNTVYITGLPFAVAADNQISAGACNFYKVTFGDFATAWINAAASTSHIRILKQTTGGTNANLITNDLSTLSDSEISFTISYHT